MVKIKTIILVLILSSIAFSGEIYTWTDANGVKRFSNTAPPHESKVVGKETNYVAPPEPPKPKLTPDDRAIMKEKETQLQIEREKTMQKTFDAQAEKFKAIAAQEEARAKANEMNTRHLNSLIFGRPME